MDLSLLDTKKIPFFVCIGTMKNHVDSVSCYVGSYLEALYYNVYGTKDKPVMALNCNYYAEKVRQLDKNIYEVIALDAVVTDNTTEEYFVKNESIKPGIALGKELTEIGNKCIKINVLKEYNAEESMRIILSNSEEFQERIQKISFELFNMLDIHYTSSKDKNERKDKIAMRIGAMILKGDTIRGIAKKLGISKSCVCNYSFRIKRLNPYLFDLVQKKKRHNFLFKHIRGGNSTRLKWLKPTTI